MYIETLNILSMVDSSCCVSSLSFLPFSVLMN